MISSRHRFIFLHVPKTGGNSVQSLLLPFSDDRMTATHHQDGRHRFGIIGSVTPRKHATLQEYGDILGTSRLEDYRIAIVLRAPFERMVSLYFSPHRWQDTAPAWNRDAFMDMVSGTASTSSFLRLGNGTAMPDFPLRFDALERDIGKMILDLGLPAAPREFPQLNTSSMMWETRRDILSDPVLRREVESFFPDDVALLNTCFGA